VFRDFALLSLVEKKQSLTQAERKVEEQDIAPGVQVCT
jgi:hypothetical protein